MGFALLNPSYITASGFAFAGMSGAKWFAYAFAIVLAGSRAPEVLWVTARSAL
jgi:hypothetical protein